MKHFILYGLILLFLFAFTAFYIQSQENELTLRMLSVDWYSYSGEGVKLQYRTFENEPMLLYLPVSFEKKYYRFVDTPKDYAGGNSLPMLLVHMKGSEIIFIDIYTRHQRTKGRIAKFDRQDLENLKEQEQKDQIELKFQ
jgi:hypothetical protein